MTPYKITLKNNAGETEYSINASQWKRIIEIIVENKEDKE